MQITLRNKSYKLKNLTDQEFDLAAKLARNKQPLDQCPTCNSKMENIPGSGGVKERVQGTYRYMGKEYDCECESQIALRARYLVANIGEQYQRLDWDEWSGCEQTKETVDLYLNGWEQFLGRVSVLNFIAQSWVRAKLLLLPTLAKN